MWVWGHAYFDHLGGGGLHNSGKHVCIILYCFLITQSTTQQSCHLLFKEPDFLISKVKKKPVESKILSKYNRCNMNLVAPHTMSCCKGPSRSYKCCSTNTSYSVIIVGHRGNPRVFSNLGKKAMTESNTHQLNIPVRFFLPQFCYFLHFLSFLQPHTCTFL